MDSTPPDQSFAQLRHDLANPLSAILAETQLLLLEQPDLDPEIRRALQTIEQMSLRMRAILLQS
ncbi:MAG: histidine kinase dimerization/phospho-acceptor domain-containing protein [Gemmatimonadota bacterium]|nr:histidine kinase dimerization/phospho-acceptor domain-containing protein [Gemmatimonadota bacterium]